MRSFTIVTIDGFQTSEYGKNQQGSDPRRIPEAAQLMGYATSGKSLVRRWCPTSELLNERLTVVVMNN